MLVTEFGGPDFKDELFDDSPNLGRLFRLVARDHLRSEGMRERAQRHARWAALASWLSFAAAFSLIMYVTALR
jgi:anti-sigma-K factor RskA